MPPDLAPLLGALAAELDGARDELEALSTRLCGDPAVVAHHLAALQAIDRVGQYQAAAAAVLRAADPWVAAAAVPLEAVRARLAPLLAARPS